MLDKKNQEVVMLDYTPLNYTGELYKVLHCRKNRDGTLSVKYQPLGHIQVTSVNMTSATDSWVGYWVTFSSGGKKVKGENN